MKEQATIGRRHHPDYVLLTLATILIAIGLIVIYSISPILSNNLLGSTDKNYFFKGQVFSLCIAAIAFIIGSKTGYVLWKKISLWLMIISLITCIILFIPGIGVAKNGAIRWIDLKWFRFQPSEILKFSLIIYLASWVGNRVDKINDIKDSILPFGLILFIVALPIVMLQKDMGTMIVMIGSSIAILFSAGLKYKNLLIIGIITMCLAAAAIISFPHRISRLSTFFHPDQNTSEEGYQINQALIAVGSGGISGVGLGKSIQVYGYLPEASNDSIFAIIAEQFGLIGTVLVISLFGLMMYRGYKIAKYAPDNFSQLIAVGATTSIAFQAVINIGAMLALVPLTGIPLPFVSFGGSSLVISLLMVGLLYNISKYTLREENYAYSSQRRGDGRSYFTGSGHNRRTEISKNQ